ncbi:MAG: selenium cofactor biosynthesis protein YqeC [Actinomycetota bacterium]
MGFDGPVPVTALADTLGWGVHELVAVVGGGGKTTTLFAAGQQLAGRVVLTTTTKMGRNRTGGLPVLVAPADADLDAALDAHGTVLVWAEAVDDAHGERAVGVTPEWCDQWFDRADHVVVEADGSRGRPFKAPAAYEPVVPARTTMLVACVGVDAIGQPIAEGCHRPEIVAAEAGCSAAEVLTPERLVRVLTSATGSRKGQPEHARFGVLLNQVTEQDRPAVTEVVDRLAQWDPSVPVAVIAPFAPGESPEA